jgi:hypothetical protein
MSINTKSIWNSEVCKHTDEDRSKNPEKYEMKDKKTSAMLDHIVSYRNENFHNEKNEAEHFIRNINNKMIKDTDLTNRQLGILIRVYGHNWKNQLTIN